MLRTGSGRVAWGVCCLALALVGPSADTVPARLGATLSPVSPDGGSEQPTDPDRSRRSAGGGDISQSPELGASDAVRIARTVASPAAPPASVPAASAIAGDDIPVVALLAYRQAADVIASAAPACGLRWTLLAAVGRVESDHGRYGGAVLGGDGVSRPAIRGVALDGTGPLARIPDTDAGELDGDRVWDRAVGPMQFLPSTWAVVGVDGDVDGTRSPDDLDDAALAAGVYLCAAGHDLREPGGTRAALLTYNHTAAYAGTVMRLEERYRAGDLTIATGYAAVVASPVAFAQRPFREARHVGGRDGRARHGAGDQPRPPTRPKDGPPPPVDAVPPEAGGPVDVPPVEPAGEPPTPAEPEAPETLTVTGVLLVCETGLCLDQLRLDVGTVEHQAATALADHDQDGVVETRGEELAGLVGATVELTAAEDGEPLLVLGVGGLPYREEPSSPETDETDEPAPEPEPAPEDTGA